MAASSSNEELMGSFAEHVAGLVFEKLKTFNFNQSGHVEVGGSSERGVEDEEMQVEEREGDAAADEDAEEEEDEHAEEGSRGDDQAEKAEEGSRVALSIGQQTAAYVGPKTRLRSRFHLVNEPIDPDAPLTETEREQLQRFRRDMTDAPLPNLILDAAPTEPRPLPNPFLDPLPIEPEAAQDAPSADVGVEAEAAPTALQTYRRTLRPRKPARALKSPYLRK